MKTRFSLPDDDKLLNKKKIIFPQSKDVDQIIRNRLKDTRTVKTEMLLNLQYDDMGLESTRHNTKRQEKNIPKTQRNLYRGSIIPNDGNYKFSFLEKKTKYKTSIKQKPKHSILENETRLAQNKNVDVDQLFTSEDEDDDDYNTYSEKNYLCLKKQFKISNSQQNWQKNSNQDQIMKKIEDQSLKFKKVLRKGSEQIQKNSQQISLFTNKRKKIQVTNIIDENQQEFSNNPRAQMRQIMNSVKQSGLNSEIEKQISQKIGIHNNRFKKLIIKHNIGKLGDRELKPKKYQIKQLIQQGQQNKSSFFHVILINQLFKLHEKQIVQENKKKFVQCDALPIDYGLSEILLDILKKQTTQADNMKSFIQKFSQIAKLDYSLFVQKDTGINIHQLDFQQLEVIKKEYLKKSGRKYNSMIKQLENLAIFKNLSQVQKKNLLMFSKLVNYDKNQSIYSDNNPNVYVVLYGCVAIYLEKTSENNEHYKNVITSKYDGDFFGTIQGFQDIFPVDYQRLMTLHQSYRVEINKKDFEEQKKDLGHFTYQVRYLFQCTENTYCLQIKSDIFMNITYQNTVDDYKLQTEFLSQIGIFFIQICFKMFLNLSQLKCAQKSKQRYSTQETLFQVGMIIISRGDKVEEFYLIRQGCVRLIYDDENSCTKNAKLANNLNYKKKFFLKTLSVGQYFGERAILNQQEKEKKILEQDYLFDMNTAHLQVISDTPNLQLYCFNRDTLQCIDNYHYYHKTMNKFTNSVEFDHFDKEVLKESYNSWRQQNQQIDLFVQDAL